LNHYGRLRLEPGSDGYADCLFHDLRFDRDGAKTDFVFNDSNYADAQIIVADHNWGCGSSREHAVWVLQANNIRCVIAPSFGDIHYNNCIKQGVLPVVLDSETCERLRAHLHEAPGEQIAIDLHAQTVTAINGTKFNFQIDAFDRQRLLQGLDDIGLTNEFSSHIDQFEIQRQGYEWL